MAGYLDFSLFTFHFSLLRLSLFTELSVPLHKISNDNEEDSDYFGGGRHDVDGLRQGSEVPGGRDD